MLPFLHVPGVLALSHKTRKLTYMVYTMAELYSRFISFYIKYCDGDGGEYRLTVSPNNTRENYVFTLRLPERIPGAAYMQQREFFRILRRQYAIQYAPVPALPVKLDADAWEDLL